MPGGRRVRLGELSHHAMALSLSDSRRVQERMARCLSGVGMLHSDVVVLQRSQTFIGISSTTAHLACTFVFLPSV